MEAIYLKSQKVPHRDIQRLVKISSRTLAKWIRMYQQGGIDALKQLHWRGARGALKERRPVLEEYFKKHPPVSVKEACATIKKLTGIERHKSAVRDFLRSMNMGFRKTGNVPGKADPVKQEEFKKKPLSPCFRKPKMEHARSSSLTQPISCGRGLWDFSGA